MHSYRDKLNTLWSLYGKKLKTCFSLSFPTSLPHWHWRAWLVFLLCCFDFAGECCLKTSFRRFKKTGKSIFKAIFFLSFGLLKPCLGLRWPQCHLDYRGYDQEIVASEYLCGLHKGRSDKNVIT